MLLKFSLSRQTFFAHIWGSSHYQIESCDFFQVKSKCHYQGCSCWTSQDPASLPCILPSLPLDHFFFDLCASHIYWHAPPHPVDCFSRVLAVPYGTVCPVTPLLKAVHSRARELVTILSLQSLGLQLSDRQSAYVCGMTVSFSNIFQWSSLGILISFPASGIQHLMPIV